jgi:hypothetical protein
MHRTDAPYIGPHAERLPKHRPEESGNLDLLSRHAVGRMESEMKPGAHVLWNKCKIDLCSDPHDAPAAVLNGVLVQPERHSPRHTVRKRIDSVLLLE